MDRRARPAGCKSLGQEAARKPGPGADCTSLGRGTSGVGRRTMSHRGIESPENRRATRRLQVRVVEVVVASDAILRLEECDHVDELLHRHGLVEVWHR